MLYLASQSPRRQELLKQAGVAFSVLALPTSGFGSVEEVRRADESAVAYVQRMARSKAVVGLRYARLRHLPCYPVLGADTEVVLADRVYGKARNRDEARLMLRTLSGQTHSVISAVALATIDQRFVRLKSVVVLSRVSFRPLSEADLDAYLASDEWQGKAGAYAIQGRAGAFVSWLAGSYSGVVGLPLCETLGLLAQ